jgi:hypothetical protein
MREVSVADSCFITRNNIVHVAVTQYKCTVRLELERQDKRRSSDGMKQELRIELAGKTSWLVRTETLSRMFEKQERN